MGTTSRSTPSSTISPPASADILSGFRGFFLSKRGRILRENLTAYLFLAPAGIVIFVFGIFPVGFALFVSLHRWRLVPGPYHGLENYTRAIDVLAYVGVLWLGIGALLTAAWLARRVWLRMAEHSERPLLWLLPSAVSGAGALLFVRFTVLWLPELLDIGEKLKGQQRTDELVMRLFGETFQVPAVSQAMWLSLVVLAVGGALAVWVARTAPGKEPIYYYSNLVFITILVIIGAMVLLFGFNEVQSRYIVAAETGNELDIWTRIVTISAGLVLLGLAWFVWQKAGGQSSNLRTGLILLAALTLMAGGWILAGELPRVIAAGDSNVYQGFLVTVSYSVGTVPAQLVIALFLAYLLFQGIRGQSAFRMIYFIPYVTPAVASAAVFRIIFSNRPDSLANQVGGAIGMGPQQWLLEPRGVFELLAAGAGASLPAWAAGPSLSLVVIILFNIWTFVGYNTVIFLAGLGAIPAELYEAGRIDGGGRWALFRHITLPLLSPTTFFLSLMGIIGTFKAFNHVWVLRNAAALGTTDTVSITIFLQFFRDARLGYASALAFMLFAVILGLTLVQNRIAAKRVFYG
mgnify:CR=1 FL=1